MIITTVISSSAFIILLLGLSNTLADSSLRGNNAKNRHRELIIGGQTVTDPDRYPYFALMTGTTQCGAVLISKRFVLTAAHCVGADTDFQIGISKRQFSLTAWFTNSNGGGTEYPYKNVVIHPNYKDGNLNSDIALYELDQDVPDSIPYIRLEQAPVAVSGTPMAVIGFGDTDPSATAVMSDVLLQTTVDFVPQIDCNNRMRRRNIGPDMLCAHKKGEDSCEGDSGGPLFLKGATSADDSLVGLVSWGYECGGDSPGVYTNIAYFYDWIVESMCAMNPDAVPDYIVCNNVTGGSGGNTFMSDGSGGSNSTQRDLFQDIADWFNEVFASVTQWLSDLFDSTTQLYSDIFGYLGEETHPAFRIE